MDITKDIRPLTEFKRDTARFLTRLKDTGRPSVLTVNGRPALVVMDAQAWQEVQDQLDYAAAVVGIRKGLDQARAGRGIRAQTFFEEFDTRNAAE
ncbi:MAG: type II toxin-antitoxin system Phd/YefM family antitoxin [Spirochaetaceae bacterium]|nr:type II toxin-antitoxin system Phd/YefM family antitoxin [Spirochaetaceae bacterium]